MTAAYAAGAASHEKMDWQAIEWPKAHTIVRRLQARIVKATQYRLRSLKSGHIYKAASRLSFACGVSNGHNVIP
jgi:hypothetical protein